MNARLQTITVVVPLILLLTGCGVTIGAKKVDLGKSEVSNGEGVVYALPKTTFDAVQPVTLVIPGGGVLAGVWDECRKACKSHDATSDQVMEACTPETSARVKFGIPVLRSRSAPDTNQLYRVEADADLFQSLSMKFEIDQSGVIKSADTSAQNLIYDLVATLVKDVIATAPASLLKALSSTRFTGMLSELNAVDVSTKAKKIPKRSCYAVSVDVAERAKGQSWTKKENQPDMCGLAKQIEGCIKPSEKALSDASKRLGKLFESVDVQKADAKVIEAVASFRREQITEAKAHLAEVKGAYGLADAKTTEATFVISIPVGAPDEMQSMSRRVSLLEKLNSSEATVAGTSDNAGKFVGLLLKAITETASNDRNYEVEVLKEGLLAGKREAEPDSGTKGYRYRVPVESVVKFRVKDAKGNGLPGSVTELRTVAQHGPIAALTSHFNGKGGKVLIKLWPDSGGIQTVEIGAEPLPASAFSGPLDELSKQVKARKDADAKAAAVDQELETLKRDVAIKELEKKKKDLEKQLAE